MHGWDGMCGVRREMVVSRTRGSDASTKEKVREEEAAHTRVGRAGERMQRQEGLPGLHLVDGTCILDMRNDECQTYGVQVSRRNGET